VLDGETEAGPSVHSELGTPTGGDKARRFGGASCWDAQSQPCTQADTSRRQRKWGAPVGSHFPLAAWGRWGAGTPLTSAGVRSGQAS
jgi:hypothetical protein